MDERVARILSVWVVVVVVVVALVVGSVIEENAAVAADAHALFLIEIKINRGKGVVVFVTAANVTMINSVSMMMMIDDDDDPATFYGRKTPW